MPGTAIVTIGQKQWQVYLATTYEEMIQGLGGISAILPQTGMLFDMGFDQTITVTTAPMLFPLDIVFISSDLRVVDIARNVPPGGLVTSNNFARYFLEVNAGETTEVQTGDGVHVHILAYPAVVIPPIPPDPVSTIVNFGMTAMAMLFMGGIARSVIDDAFAPPEKELPPERKLLPPGRLPKTEPKLTITSTCIQCGKEFPAARDSQRNLCAKCLTPGPRSWVQEELPFAATGIGNLWWLATIGGKTYQVEARGIRGLTERQLEDAFADSTAKISVPYEERGLGRGLPFAVAEKGKLWWLATIEGKTHQVEVGGIRGLTERQLEDAFADSTAWVYIPFLEKLPQTEHGRSRLEQLEKEALELQRKIRARWPAHVPEPWPEELKRLQGRLWELGYEIIKEERRLKHLPEVKHFPQVDREKPPGWFRWRGNDEPEDREEKLEDKWFQRGVKAGKTDGWMTLEETLEEMLPEILKRHAHREIDAHELVWSDIDEWETTDHFQIFYGSNMMEDARGDLDLYSELKAEFWEGYLTGRKEIGIDIYKIAAELVKSPPGPERARIATISLRGDMYIGEIKDQFGLVESATVARTVEEVKKWAKEHGATDLRIEGSNPSAGLEVTRGFFVGACRIEGRLCHTHGLSVDERVRCPKSPLTDDEWRAVYQLAEIALGKGDRQIIDLWASTIPEEEIIHGHWPATLEDALKAIRKYELSMRTAVERYAASLKASIDHYRQSAERAIIHYRDYVMRLYARRAKEAKETLEKHPQTIPNPTIARKRSPRPTRYDVTVDSWMERDRLGIWITDNRTDETIAEWWDEGAREMFEQGFFRPDVPQYTWEKPGREFIDSVLDYAEAAGLLARDNPRRGKESKAKVIPYHPPPRGQAGLEFMADGPQHLTQTIDAIGYRTQIDNAFQEAIARAKGTLTPRE